jgi:nucleoside-diphosphate-sugar epimerase
VVEGLLAAAVRPDVCGSIFHLVDPTPVTQRDYIASCQRDAAGAPRVHYVPRPLFLAVGTVLDIAAKRLTRNLPLSSYRVRSINELTFDCSAAQRQLGWEPTTGVIADVTTRRQAAGRAERIEGARSTGSQSEPIATG